MLYQHLVTAETMMVSVVYQPAVDVKCRGKQCVNFVQSAIFTPRFTNRRTPRRQTWWCCGASGRPSSRSSAGSSSWPSTPPPPCWRPSPATCGRWDTRLSPLPTPCTPPLPLLLSHAVMRLPSQDPLLAWQCVSWGFFSRFFSDRPQTYPLVGKGLPADALLARVRAIRPSLGASGAVVAVFAIVAARQPDRQARRRLLWLWKLQPTPSRMRCVSGSFWSAANRFRSNPMLQLSVSASNQPPPPPSALTLSPAPYPRLAPSEPFPPADCISMLEAPAAVASFAACSV